MPPPVADLTNCVLEEVDRRLPGGLTGLLLHGSLCWGEFFPGRYVDFVGLWERPPRGGEVHLLRAAHEATRCRIGALAFDGFHCTPADLAAPPTRITHRPAFFEGTFDSAGTVDVHLVTWHELAERGIAVRGAVPAVYTNLDELLDFTSANLDTYWRGFITTIEQAGIETAGEQDDTVTWIRLGSARLHHLLFTNELTSKSGAGRYVRDALDPRWSRIAREALRIREEPESERPVRRSRPAGPGRLRVALLACRRWLRRAAAFVKRGPLLDKRRVTVVGVVHRSAAYH